MRLRPLEGVPNPNNCASESEAKKVLPDSKLQGIRKLKKPTQHRTERSL
jgi:hypothetical protein